MWRFLRGIEGDSTWDSPCGGWCRRVNASRNARARLSARRQRASEALVPRHGARRDGEKRPFFVNWPRGNALASERFTMTTKPSLGDEQSRRTFVKKTATYVVPAI